jgi:hypothetical protein
MGDLGNSWRMSDFVNAQRAWIGQQSKSHRQIILWKFLEYETAGNLINPSETIRRIKYAQRLDHVWLSLVKVYDTVKGGYFTTGDLDVHSDFALQGYSASYTLPDNTIIPEYGGDVVQWNGKLWEVADQLEPVQWGYQAKQVFFHTVLRRTQRSGIGVQVGP